MGLPRSSISIIRRGRGNMRIDNTESAPGILKGLEFLILEAVQVYRAADIDSVRDNFPAQRLAKFKNHISSKPDPKGAPLMLYWPQDVFLFGRESDVANPQALSLAWIRAASGKTNHYCRCRALWLLPLTGRDFQNIVLMPRNRGIK